MNNCLMKLASIVCTIHIVVQQCDCLDLIDLPYQPGQEKWKKADHKSNTEPLQDNKHIAGPVKLEEHKSKNQPPKPIRKYWLLNENSHYSKAPVHLRVYEDEKDTNLKQKIANLVDQTMKDTQKKMKQTEEIQEERRDEPSYKVGFILCMIKKSKNVMDELFNVAVKHKDQWKSLQHLKVFELIVHTNVDSTNLLRQLVDANLLMNTSGGLSFGVVVQGEFFVQQCTSLGWMMMNYLEADTATDKIQTFEQGTDKINS